VSSTTDATSEGAAMNLTSPAFVQEASIPARFTCDGDDVSPELVISAVPADTVSMVLIMDDPDAPGETWDHWVAYDVSPTTSIPEDVGPIGTAGANSWQRTGYGGPCPPSGTHRYFFTVLALDSELGLPEGAGKAEVLAAAEGHVIAEAVLMGTYSR
jgi:Raf kinase inhibitor-like YbhB/YbcL family protein